MTVNTELKDNTMTVTVDGEINTITAPELSKAVEDLSGVSKLYFDLERVPYVSSAGLRIFLTCQRTMNAGGGEMRIMNIDELVAEIFESVGYNRIMKLELKGQTSENDAGSER